MKRLIEIEDERIERHLANVKRLTKLYEEKYNNMTEEMKQKLRDAGREDLVKVNEINESGYAGVDRNGQIVDRREHPEAVPVQRSSVFPNIPAPIEPTKTLS